MTEFTPPTVTDLYRRCESCRELVDRRQVSAGVCPLCGEPVLRSYGPPFDELREQTGANLAQCRRALSLAEGDVTVAAQLLTSVEAA